MRRDRPERRGVARGVVQTGELVVENHQRQREPGHVERGDELADLRPVRPQPGRREPTMDLSVADEHFLVLRAPESVDDDGDPPVADVGELGEHGVDEDVGDLVGAHPLGRPDTRLAVDPEAELHVTGVHREQRLGLAGQRAAVERDAEGAGGGVGLACGRLHPGQVVAAVGGRAGDLEDEQSAGDPAPVVGVLGRAGGDVVRHQHGAVVDALAGEPPSGETEVHDVAGVVAETEQHAGAAVGRAGGAVDLLGARAGEDVADDGSVGEAVADQPGERRVVPAPAADDDGHLAGPRHVPADDAVGVRHPAHGAAVRRHEAVDPVGLERLGRAEQGHRRSSAVVGAATSASSLLRTSSRSAAIWSASASASGFGG